MGDTQKSPTISTANQGIAAKAAYDSGQGLKDPAGEGAPLLLGESSLARVRMLAEREPNLVSISLAQRIDLYLLKKSFAKRNMDVLPNRFNEHGLVLHPEKTAVVDFRKPPSKVEGKGNCTFDFLGFTFYWSKSRRGYWVIKKKTAGRRLLRFLKAVWQLCRENRHKPIKEQYRTRRSKLRGYYQYFGVRSNYKALDVVHEYVEKAWRFWLSRRGHKGGISWAKFEKIRLSFPLPKPRIVHNI